MSLQSDWSTTVERLYTGLLEVIAAYLPKLFGGLLLLLAGWLLATVLRIIVTRLATGLGRLLPRLLPGNHGLRGPGRMPGVIGALVFWIVLLAFLTAASQVLGLTVFAVWLDRILAQLPLLAAAALILVFAFALGQFARRLVEDLTASLDYRGLLGAAAQVSVWVIALVIALDLIGLDTTFLVVLAGILLGGVAGGAALAFGLGARSWVEDLLGIRELQGRYREGDRIRLGELEGQIVELTARSVILEMPDGRTAIPGRMFSERPCTLLIREQAGE
ncbi:MAG: mechanosensitive ion channel family protein [Gammaproteobacteria bacterium]